jgi:hypothetical protein
VFVAIFTFTSLLYNVGAESDIRFQSSFSLLTPVDIEDGGGNVIDWMLGTRRN